MKNLALIIIAVLGVSATSFAQDGTKQTEPSKGKSDKNQQEVKPQRGNMKKSKETTQKKENPVPIKKAN